MNSSGYSPNGDMTARQAGMHLRGSDGELFIPENAEPPPEREFDTGGMGLFSTMQDYARFLGIFRTKDPTTVGKSCSRTQWR